MSRDHTCRISGAGAMVQTASTNEADRSHVPGATTIPVLGPILILQGGYRLYVVAGAVVVLFAQSGLFYQTPFALTLAGLCLRAWQAYAWSGWTVPGASSGCGYAR